MTDLIELFAEYNAREMPAGDIRMSCPFTENHTGSADGSKSFRINEDRTYYQCFSCKKRGSMLSLLTVKFKLSIVDALEIANIAESVKKIVKVNDDSPDVPTYVPEQIIDFSKQPKAFLDRGFPKEVLRHFKVGVRIDAKGNEITTIPLEQVKRLVGIKGRFERNFWYEPYEFQRSKFIYNEHNFSQTVLMEGETDVYRSVANGIEYSSALLGSDITPGQVQRLKRYKRIYLAMDNDRAGTMGAELVYRHLCNDVEILFVPYVESDPGDVKSPEAWKQAISQAADYAVYSSQMAIHMGEMYLRIQRKIINEFNN